MITAEGESSEIYPAMELICIQFMSWLLKNPPSTSSSIKVDLKDFIDEIEKEIVR